MTCLQELLAVVLALQDWRHWLEGAAESFLVWIDHKNLDYLRGAKRCVTLPKHLSDSIAFSGPLPNLANDDILSCVSSLHRWLSRWCPENNVAYIDNWQTFWGKPFSTVLCSVHFH